MRTIKEIPIAGKRVLIRVDFNVPLDADGNITDDTRIMSALPTLHYALEQDAKLIIASHLGRPKGQVDPGFSLLPVAGRLSELLGKTVEMAPDSIGPQVQSLVDGLEPGGVVLLENLRFYAQEQQNDDDFAKELAALCDVYINDAFAVSHRVNASVVGVVRHAPESAAGLLLKKELDYFKLAMDQPKRPLVAIVGGAKVSSKLAALRNMLRKVDTLIIGGAMANTFLRSKGYKLGRSRIEEDLVEVAGSVLKTAAAQGVQVYLPVDAVAAAEFDADAENNIFTLPEIPSDWMVLDIGPETSSLYANALDNAGTIVWNGPMGVFEMEAFSKGTFALVKSVAESDAMTIIGGGDTDAAVHRSGEIDRITYMSTGGGAFLALLEGKKLPGVAALD
ncbi:MAG: phosphoglycerate kinase [Desulfobacteraceae bacterium 4572_123]|nr:MAG: phosphoglycerate kinase [Desulfobacteraceae bacterium 4572_123]